MGVAVLVGTRKGLFVLTSDGARQDWSLEGPLLTGWEVFHALRDPRTGVVHAATNNWVYGATGYYRYDEGYTPDFEGREDFAGDILHPQFWPENYDYAGKKVDPWPKSFEDEKPKPSALGPRSHGPGLGSRVRVVLFSIALSRNW